MPPAAPRTVTLDDYKVQSQQVMAMRSDEETAHLASRGGESPSLEEAEGLACGEHGEVSREMKKRGIQLETEKAIN